MNGGALRDDEKPSKIESRMRTPRHSIVRPLNQEFELSRTDLRSDIVSAYIIVNKLNKPSRIISQWRLSFL